MNDDELREMFQAQRRDDARRAPEFRSLWKKPRKKSPFRVIVPIATFAAAAAVFIVWCKTQEMASAPPMPSDVAQIAPEEFDPSPLDFLLDGPNFAALSGTPDFGKER